MDVKLDVGPLGPVSRCQAWAYHVSPAKAATEPVGWGNASRWISMRLRPAAPVRNMAVRYRSRLRHSSMTASLLLLREEWQQLLPYSGAPPSPRIFGARAPILGVAQSKHSSAPSHWNPIETPSVKLDADWPPWASRYQAWKNQTDPTVAVAKPLGWGIRVRSTVSCALPSCWLV